MSQSGSAVMASLPTDHASRPNEAPTLPLSVRAFIIVCAGNSDYPATENTGQTRSSPGLARARNPTASQMARVQPQMARAADVRRAVLPSALLAATLLTATLATTLLTTTLSTTLLTATLATTLLTTTLLTT